MALDDLSESMERLANFMDKTFLRGAETRALRKKIDEARRDKRQDDLKKLLVEVRSYFEGWGGGYYDVLFCKENNNIPEGMTTEYANKTFRELLGEVFFNLLFWDSDREEAATTYHEALETYNRMLDDEHERFLKKYPEWIGKPRGQEPSLGEYYHFDSEWFREWSDLGKLPADSGTKEV